MQAMTKIQLYILGHDHMPVIPILSTAELPSSLGILRRQQSGNMTNKNEEEAYLQSQELVSFCVRGPPLSKRQVKIMMDASTGFSDLAHSVYLHQNQEQVCNLLGKSDAKRVISFLTNGPMPVDG